MAAVMEPIDAAGGSIASRCAVMHGRFRRPLERFFASYRLDKADVDDLTQEVFLRLAGNACPANLLSPDAFVFTLARNLIRDRARRLYTKAATRSVCLDEVELHCDRPTPEEMLEHQQCLARVSQVLASMKDTTRHAFLLHRVHGYSYAEIAREMRVSVSMVEKHVMAAISALRNMNEGYR